MDFLTEQLAQVGWFIVLLFMLLIGLAFLMRRKLGLDLPALTRLNFYGLAPGMIYTEGCCNHQTMFNDHDH